MASSRRPILFHRVHGKGIVLESDFTASRPEGFNGGITFSNRPISVQEVVSFKILETSTNWSGAVRIGFTINDPKTMRHSVPDHSCPDLVKVYGNWIKHVPESVNIQGDVISFYVDLNGDVYYDAPNRETRHLLNGVKTSETLWAVIDIYGNTVSIELLDPSRDLTFHESYFNDISLTNGKRLASKKKCKSPYWYMFTSRPLKLNETLKILVGNTEPSNPYLFEYGITSCDPNTISPESLPERTEKLFDRPEYWIVQEDVNYYKQGDCITYEMDGEGKMSVKRNNALSTYFYVDTSQPFWLFFKLSEFLTDISIHSVFDNTDADISEEVQNLTLSTSREDSKSQTSNECIICYENPVDCVIYRCGHMCLCIACAEALKTERSKGECPLCRKVILDIIKVYK